MRKRSDSGKCFICAKAKRQRQMFSVAKAKRQLQMFYLCESVATATTKRPVGTEINHTFDDEQKYKNTYSLHQDEVLNAKTICYNHLVFKKF
ncbi:hypothetical protein ACZ11_23475 [Lysinibacillus xylanilyticus]|uniref:Uncharacterized protein n=1 Tax=Lysinibacillus xylanilyticus TaxID=582475 RepID=A0A0K9F0Z1_9BACI|nr:hypothetical protein [Lysinibacillus xylanilyticus]KMY28200.1 hypothetical protein ACZ11_23475 [Lysinibacillus xylanilyticus]